MMNSLLFLFLVTVNPIRVSVDGDGYLRLSRDGRAVYAKTAHITVAANGRLATPEGDAILPTIMAPTDAIQLDVDLEGNVFAVKSGARAKIGRLVLALFPESSVLTEKNGVLLAVDRPQLGNPGDDTNGVIRVESVTAKKESISTQGGAPQVIKPEVKPEPKVEPKTEIKKPDVKVDTIVPSTGAITEPKPRSEAPKVEPKSMPKPSDTLPKVTADKTQPAPQPSPDKKLSSGGGKITLPGTAEVNADTILLGDIATIETDDQTKAVLAQIDLGDTPTFGAKKVIDRAKIIAKIKLAGYNIENFVVLLPGSIEVHRAAQNIPQSDFIAAAVKAVSETPGLQTEYECKDVAPDFQAPAGRVTLVVEAVSGVNTSTVLVKVAVYVEGKRINSRSLKFNARAGSTVSIRTGSTVKVIFRSSAAEVELTGIARSTAKLGEPIQIEVRANNTDKTIHQGTVISAGVVEVKI